MYFFELKLYVSWICTKVYGQLHPGIISAFARFYFLPVLFA